MFIIVIFIDNKENDLNDNTTSFLQLQFSVVQGLVMVSCQGSGSC